MPDMERMAAVGAGASTSKSKTDLSGKETLTNVSIERADNGGFIVRCSYEKEPAKGAKDSYPSYVKPKQYVVESVQGLLQLIQSMFADGGEGQSMRMPSTGASAGGGLPMPAPAPE